MYTSYAVLEFKQRQPEVERSQVITSIKIGEGGHATVSTMPPIILCSKV